MLATPILLFYAFFVLLVFVIGVAPTAFWQRLGATLSTTAARRRRERLAARFARAAAHFARATQGQPFTPDITYLPDGIGFALDRARALLFLAGERGAAPAEAILPLAAFRAHAQGVLTGGLADETYIDLLPVDPAEPVWRIACGPDPAPAAAIARLLATLGLPA